MGCLGGPGPLYKTALQRIAANTWLAVVGVLRPLKALQLFHVRHSLARFLLCSRGHSRRPL